MSDTPLRVVIADDHPAQRMGARMALEDDGFEVVAEAADTPEAVTAALRHRPDVCLLDVRMPGGGGVLAAAQIAKALPATAIVMLTVSQEETDLFQALQAGAGGYLLKDMNAARLGPAIRGVIAGEAALPRALVARLIDEFRGRDRRRRLPVIGGRRVSLTAREWEILEFLREGRPTSEIAELLSIAPVTVRTHVAAILHKLRVGSREEMMRLLEERTLV